MLLEREKELGQLVQILADVQSSGGKVVLLRGEAGIGKSALVRELVSRQADRAHIHFGSCDDLLIPQPLSPFWDMARAEPSLKGPVVDGDRPRLLEVVLDLLSTSLRPTLMVIEDTHWADEATLDAIKYLGRRISSTNGLLLITYRDGVVDYDHPLRGVIGDLPPQSVVRIRLTGLSLSAVSSIIADSGLDPEEVMAATRGNPFLVTEMAAGAGEMVPSSLQDSVMARVGTLSPEARTMLKTLSVIPEPQKPCLYTASSAPWPPQLSLSSGGEIPWVWSIPGPPGGTGIGLRVPPKGLLLRARRRLRNMARPKPWRGVRSTSRCSRRWRCAMPRRNNTRGC